MNHTKTIILMSGAMIALYFISTFDSRKDEKVEIETNNQEKQSSVIVGFNWKTNLLEEAILNNSDLLSDKEKLEYRLHYASINYDRLSEVVNKLNEESSDKHDVGYYNSIFLEKINNSILLQKNDLMSNDLLQTSIRNYLENNPVDMKNFGMLSSREQSRLSGQYANWVWAYGAAMGEKDLDDYLYRKAYETTDPIELLAFIDFQRDRVEIKEDSREVDRLVKNSRIKETLESSLFNPELDEITKLRIKRISEIYYDYSEPEHEPVRVI